MLPAVGAADDAALLRLSCGCWWQLLPPSCQLLRAPSMMLSYGMSSTHTLCTHSQGCHTGYWMGYKAAQWGAANFAPLDRTVPFNKTSYVNWGLKMLPNRNVSEPDGRAVPELCLVANQTAAVGGAYGWADVQCERNRFVHMCRIIREWPSLLASTSCCGTAQPSGRALWGCKLSLQQATLCSWCCAAAEVWRCFHAPCIPVPCLACTACCWQACTAFAVLQHQLTPMSCHP